jgi:hypothetical protein
MEFVNPEMDIDLNYRSKEVSRMAANVNVVVIARIVVVVITV